MLRRTAQSALLMKPVQYRASLSSMELAFSQRCIDWQADLVLSKEALNECQKMSELILPS
jgi:hypothetical protein